MNNHITYRTPENRFSRIKQPITQYKCVFCKDRTPTRDTISGELFFRDGLVTDPYIILEGNNGNPRAYLIAHHSRTEIRYCPKCGRDLLKK